MPEVKLLVTNRLGSPVAELSRASLKSVSWILNDPGKLQFSMKQSDPKVTIPLLGKNEIQLWLDGALAWWGVPWRCRNNKSTADFECEGLLSYFNKRFVLNASLEYTDLEQFQIAYGLITSSQAGTGQTFNITTASVPASGVVRSRRYERDEHPNILTLLQEFPTLSRADNGVHDGFDYDIDISAGQRVFTPYYPYRGVLRPKHKLEYGRNVVDFDTQEDAVNLANRTYCTGGNNGDIKFEENWKDDAKIAEYGVEYQAVINDGDQMDVAVLKQKAADYTRLHSDPIVNPGITAVDTPVTLLGVIKPGDVVPVVIHKGRVNFEGNMRIGGVTWNVRPNNLKFDFWQDPQAVA